MEELGIDMHIWADWSPDRVHVSHDAVDIGKNDKMNMLSLLRWYYIAKLNVFWAVWTIMCKWEMTKPLIQHVSFIQSFKYLMISKNFFASHFFYSFNIIIHPLAIFFFFYFNVSTLTVL